MEATSPATPAGQDRLPVTIWPGIDQPLCSGSACGQASRPGVRCRAPAILAVLTAFARPGDLVVADPSLCTGLDLPARGSIPAGSARPRAALAVIAARPDVGWYAQYSRLLRPGGVLAVIGPDPGPGAVADLGLAVTCARAAGLTYTQHIILVHAGIRDGLLLPAAHACHGGASGGGQPCARIHTDLLIFTATLEASDDL